ncbi:MAG TPA: hypothetical protein VE780_10550 [Thermoleophilaceae bacterium]|jgi:uncharacterized protein YjbJ (UPF0337 family)|nr:hypothetical protein [Thermoleophilaceae bacterium]
MAGRLDRAKGRLAESIGALLDNKRLKDKGRASRVKGSTKGKIDQVADEVRDRTP